MKCSERKDKKMIKDFGSFFKDLYANRKLLIQFSLNDFKAKYAGSMFGIFWAFINPIVTVITYWLVFDVGLKSPMTDGTYPFITYLLTGMVPWFFFSDVLTSGTNALREYSYLVKKVVFNIKILPTAKLLSNLYTHLFFIAVAVVVCVINGIYPTFKTFELIYYLFCMIMFLTGLTWITSAIQPFFADITQFIAMIMQILMWASPVLWSPNQFPEKVQFFFKLNPLYYVITGYRSAFFSEPTWFFDRPVLSLYFWAITIIMLVLGSGMFNKLKPHFSDVL